MNPKEATKNQRSTRNLRKKENLINFFIQSGNPGDQEKMSFESYLVTLESAKMEFQVYFENPKMISMGS